MSADPIVVAFSGGLDTSWCVPWVRESRERDVVTVTVDVGGFDAAARDALAAKSRALGAVQHVHVDARERFFDEVIRYLIMGNVLRGHAYPLCVGAERGLQAREVARVAHEVGAQAVVHGCTAAGNDQIRFEVALRTLAPDLEILAPIRDLGLSREEELEFLAQRGLPLPEGEAVYSINAGLWGVTIGGRETHDTKASLPEDAWVRTRGAFDAPRAEERHVLVFERGVPVALDGEAHDAVTLIEEIDRLAAGFGIGRGIHLGDTLLGMKGRVAFEAPAAAVILPAHRELEKLTLSRAQMILKDQAAATYGELVHSGQSLDPAARDIEALFESSQQRVSGKVFLLLRAGAVFVEGVESPHSLRDASKSVYGETAGDWTSEEARGFARISTIPSALHARAAKGVS